MTTNADLIRNCYDAFARGDVEAVLAVLDPKVQWTEAAGFPYAGTYSGPEAVLAEVFVPLSTEWESFEVVRDRITSDGTVVVAIGTYSATFKETGRPFTARFAHVWELANSKVVRFEQVADTAEVQEALA